MFQSSAWHGSTLRLYVRALREVRPYWAHLAVILALGLAFTPIALLAPLPVKLVVDSVLGSEPLPAWLAAILPGAATESREALFWTAIALAALVAIVTLAHRMVEWLFRESVAEKMVLDFRGRVFLHSLQLSPLRHAETGMHDPAYRINHDAVALQWTAVYGFIPVILAGTSLLAMLYVTAAIDLSLALVALATSVPVIVLIHLNQHRMRNEWHGVKEQETAMHAIVQEVLGALRVVTTFGQERRELDRFMRQSDRSLREKLRVIRTEGWWGAALGLATGLGTTLILYLAVRYVQAGALSIGDLLLILAYVAQLYAPLQQIGTHFTSQQQAIASAERAFALLDEQPAVAGRPDARALKRARGEFELDHAGFAYVDRAPVLRNVAVHVPAGACVGIVGRTGAGKTTLINLLIRQFDPSEGAIRLDGADLRDWRLADLRNQFAVLSQEPVLFSATIAENIAYAKPDAPIGEIIAAARKANVHEFITALPEGYNTKVGDRGMKLSGGERQRIALARAFLKDAPILILDEPTSAIDLQTEASIIESIERLMQGRTTFMIAHRLSTLRNADIVLQVEDGQVAIRPNVELKKAS